MYIDAEGVRWGHWLVFDGATLLFRLRSSEGMFSVETLCLLHLSGRYQSSWELHNLEHTNLCNDPSDWPPANHITSPGGSPPNQTARGNVVSSVCGSVAGTGLHAADFSLIKRSISFWERIVSDIQQETICYFLFFHVPQPASQWS